MIHLLALLMATMGVLVPIQSDGTGGRKLLWRVVQACVLNHRITGLSFPCLAVETPLGLDRGYAVLRPPTEDTHMIVTPTVQTVGIEAPRLRGSDAPNYFRDAWNARHFVTDDLTTKPDRDDMGLAVNSRPGRSQDQLHIHVACIRAAVKDVLRRQAADIRRQDWVHLRPLPNAPYYLVHYEASPDLAGINVFDRTADGLRIDAKKMDDVTIVVVGMAPTGFMILARQRLPHGFDEPHGEALLDPDCTTFAKRAAPSP